MALESRSRVTVSITATGLGALGAFTTRTGGNADSEETKHRAAGGEDEEALGGLPTTDNVTVTRRFDALRDGPLRNALFDARGWAPMTVTDQPLDEHNNAVVPPTVWTGVFKAFQMPDSDATSNNPAMLTIEMSTHSKVAA